MNESINSIITNEDEQIEFKFKETKRMLKDLDKKIVEYDKISDDPRRFIDTYLSELTKECMLKRKEAISKIESHYDEIMKQIKSLQKEIEKQMDHIPKSNSRSVNSMFYLNEWIGEYNTARRRNLPEPPIHIAFEANLFRLKIEKELNDYKKTILKGDCYTFVDDSILKLASLKNEQADLDHVDIVSYRLKNFKQFHNSKKCYSKLYETDTIKWKFYVENDLNGYLSCFIQINLDTIKNKYIEAEYQVELLHPEKNYSKWSNHCFDSKSASAGWTKFINLKSLQKEGYDSKDDSITFEIFINFKKIKNV